MGAERAAVGAHEREARASSTSAPSIGRAVLTVALLVVACGGREAPREPAGEATSGDEAEGSERAVWTGDVSEDAFERLHELTDEAAPPLQGRPVSLGASSAYLSLPEGEPRAAVLVIHEWWGLNDHIRHWSDRLAADGYAALAVDLYGGETATTSEEAMELMRAVDRDEGLRIIGEAVRFLRNDPRTAAAPRRGVIGWCFGGGWALESALRVGSFDAVVMYYGRPVTEPDRLRALRAPLLGVFGDEDESIPPERVDEFEAALEEAGVDHTLLRFDAPHAFANPSGARYDHEAASEAWEAVRGFFARHLLGREESE